MNRPGIPGGSAALAILACYEADADKGITVGVANNRTSSQQLHIVDAGYEYDWTWPGESGLGMRTAGPTAAHAALDNPITFLIPPSPKSRSAWRAPTARHVLRRSGGRRERRHVPRRHRRLGPRSSRPGLGGNPVVDAFIQVLYACGAENS